MSTKVHPTHVQLKNITATRWSQILGWTVVGLFVLGHFFPRLGAWTGAILGAWFVGTQKPRGGFFWLTLFIFLPSLIANWREFLRTGPEHALKYAASTFFVAILTALPFFFHRLVSPLLPGFLSTLPLPLAATVFETLALPWLPANLHSLALSEKANAPLAHIAAVFGTGTAAFLIYWFAAVVVWMWNHEFRVARIGVGAGFLGVVYILVACFEIFRPLSGYARPATLPTGAAFAWICLGVALALSIWALLHPGKHQTWAERPEIVARLRSPHTGNSLHWVSEQNREALVSEDGERFPIQDGIPIFLKPEELTGSNRKYNHLYETIGGFYDDTQRVWSALSGMDRTAYVMSYLGLLEIKPGDSVLETSVGTGLNFKYLPRDIKRFGLDLSREMLVNCQANLRRWQMDADLFLGNAESLPFADSSFDVVFHTGGINFFNDRAKAIREMIRVAKPGSLILIADETEEHVKSAYEQIPITSRYFKHRKEAVTAPIDLVPADMQEVRLESIWNGRFYALTFRKPAFEERARATQDRKQL
jgi:ubiquinone/menaquinone biosynthesis C-methylase UbiE